MVRHDHGHGVAPRGRELTIHLAQREPGGPVTTTTLYLHGADAHAVADGRRRAGVVVEGPEDLDHGTREGTR